MIMKGLPIAAFLLLLPAIASANAECLQQILIKNPKGDLKLGAIHEPPKGSDYSVWFPVIPRAIAFDSQDNIYIGDSVKYRVLKYDKNGNFLNKIPLQKPVHTKKPELSHEIRTIAVDKNDNIYVLNILEYRVEVYSSAGKFLKSIDYFKDEIDQLDTKKPRNKFTPAKASVDSEGNVYLLGGKDRKNRPTSGAKYDSTGRLVLKGVANGANHDESKMIGASNFSLDVDIYAPDKKLPGKTYIALKVKNKANETVKVCNRIDNLAEDENGPAAYLDRAGNIYSFDWNENVIKIEVDK